MWKRGTIVKASERPLRISQPEKGFKKISNRILLTAKDDSHFSVQETVVEPGGEIPTHIHTAHDEGVYVLSGEGTVVVAGRNDRLAPGTMAYGECGVSLRIVNDGSELLRLLVIFSPPFNPHEEDDKIFPGSPGWPEEPSTAQTNQGLPSPFPKESLNQAYAAFSHRSKV